MSDKFFLLLFSSLNLLKSFFVKFNKYEYIFFMSQVVIGHSLILQETITFRLLYPRLSPGIMVNVQYVVVRLVTSG